MTKPDLVLTPNEEILTEGQPQSIFIIYLTLTNFTKALTKILMILFVCYFLLLMTRHDLLTTLLTKLVDSHTLQQLGGVPERSLGDVFYVASFLKACVLQHLPAIIITLVIIFVLAVFYSLKALRNNWYFLTNQRMVIYSGVWSKHKQDIAYKTVGDINRSNNALQTLLRQVCLTITLTTTKKILGRSKQQSYAIVLNGLSVQQADIISGLIMQYRNH